MYSFTKTSQQHFKSKFELKWAGIKNTQQKDGVFNISAL